MSYLDHPPSKIIQQLLIDLALASPVSDDDSWPIYATNLPDRPDDALVVRDTEPIKQGRMQFSGEVEEHYGFQIRVRTKSPTEGYIKAAQIAAALDEDVLRTPVEVEANLYEIGSITRRSGVIHMGKEPVSARNLWAINFTASISGEGTGS